MFETPEQQERRRLGDLQSLVKICLTILLEKAEGDYKEVSIATRLCMSTLYRLARNDISLAIHVRTLYSLAEASGFKLKMSKNTIELN
jgi:hypothetical protein